MTVVAEDKDAYRASFERFASAHAASDPAWLRERRTAAIARFVEKGLPTPRDEAWRHTPVAPLTRGRFEPADPAATPPPATPMTTRAGFSWPPMAKNFFDIVTALPDRGRRAAAWRR